MTPYDWLLLRRTATLGVLLALFSLAVMVATDETSNTLAGRLGRLASVAPLVGAGATFLSLQQARTRGETRALETLGVAPVRAARGVLLGGIAIAAIGPILALVPQVDLATLFPAAAPITHHWLQKGLVWQDANRGLTIEPNGDLSWARATGITEAARLVPRGATALALALAAVGAPLWIAVKASGLRRSLVGIAVVAGAILAFHLVAAGRVSALWLALPPLGLVVDAAIRLRSRAWS